MAAISDADRSKRESAYIEMISAYCRSGETDPHLFRTLLDGWHAYRHGGPFLNRNGRPHWFNSVKPTDHRKLSPALRSMNYMSASAAEILAGSADGILVKDHGVPVAIIRDRAIKAASAQSSDLRSLLLESSWLGVITKHEHDRLNSIGQRASLPNAAGDPMRARYQLAKITESLGHERISFHQHSDHPFLLEVSA